MEGERLERMEIKESRTITSRQSEGKKAVAFVGDVKQELKKIEWTDWSELKGYTQIVLISTLSFGMFVYAIDLVMQGFLGSINLLIKLFTG